MTRVLETVQETYNVIRSFAMARREREKGEGREGGREGVESFRGLR